MQGYQKEQEGDQYELCDALYLDTFRFQSILLTVSTTTLYPEFDQPARKCEFSDFVIG